MASVRIGWGNLTERGKVPYHPATKVVHLCKPSLTCVGRRGSEREITRCKPGKRSDRTKV